MQLNNLQKVLFISKQDAPRVYSDNGIFSACKYIALGFTDEKANIVLVNGKGLVVEGWFRF